MSSPKTRPRRRAARGALAAILVLAGAALAAASPGREMGYAPLARTEAPAAIAVIVHPKNPVTNLSLNELRAILKLEKQFWPNGKRVTLYLPPSKSTETEILLDKIYRMPIDSLQKYWMGKRFSGEIPAKPSYVPNAEAAGSRVKESEGAIAVVLATQIPPGVRVLSIGDKRPGDAEYPLVAESGS
jgi:hypothetical protein